MKRKIILSLMCVMVMGLGGCLVDEIALTNSERDIIAQYAAEALLKYNSHYDRVLLAETALTPTVAATPTTVATPTPFGEQGQPAGTEPVFTTPTPTASPKPTPTSTPTPTPYPENTAYTNKQLTTVLGFNEVSAEFYRVEDPVKEYFLGDGTVALNRVPGKEHYIVQFMLTNNSSSTVALDTISKDLSCTMVINGKTTLRAETTFFPNDLRFMGASGETIAPGKSQFAILVFAVDEGTEIEKACVNIINKNSEAVLIKIK